MEARDEVLDVDTCFTGVLEKLDKVVVQVVDLLGRVDFVKELKNDGCTPFAGDSFG